MKFGKVEKRTMSLSNELGETTMRDFAATRWVVADDAKFLDRNVEERIRVKPNEGVRRQQGSQFSNFGFET